MDDCSCDGSGVITWPLGADDETPPDSWRVELCACATQRRHEGPGPLDDGYPTAAQWARGIQDVKPKGDVL